MIAHLYNTSVKNRGDATSSTTASRTPKAAGSRTSNAASWPKIDPYPWQTDTSIGDWFYNRNWKFRPVSWVIHMLVDNVSKNGNLLLNVVQRPDGSLDAEVEQMLAELAAWNAVHGEAIFGTRPWLVYGEGPKKAKKGAFNEDYIYTAKDIRFTTKGPTLYAIALGCAEGRPHRRPFAGQAGRRKRQRHCRREPARLRRQVEVEADVRRAGSDAARRDAKPVHGGA